jgi:hypothetical protein
LSSSSNPPLYIGSIIVFLAFFLVNYLFIISLAFVF